MPRIRSIKPEFFKHEELFKAEIESGFPLRVAFSGLWTVADREGRFKWKPNTIKLDVLPFDNVDMVKVLATLLKYGFIQKYTVDGRDYGLIPSWKDHQVINNRESQSVLPSPIDASFTRAHAASGEGKGRERKGGENAQGVFSEPTKTTEPAWFEKKPNIPPYKPPETFTDKKQCFDWLKSNDLVIEESQIAMTQRGWRGVDPVDIVALLKVFVNSKAKIEQPPEEIRKHLRNWLLAAKLPELTEYATNFKKSLA